MMQAMPSGGPSELEACILSVDRLAGLHAKLPASHQVSSAPVLKDQRRALL